MVKVLRFLLICAVSFVLFGCNATGNTIKEQCYKIPEFTSEVGMQQLTKWQNDLVKYPSDPEFGDLGLSAGYFTMANYLGNAVLQPLNGSKQLEATQEIYGYFLYFLARHPVVTFRPDIESIKFANVGCGYGSADGFYDIQLDNEFTHTKEVIHAKFSFIYKYESEPLLESFRVESGNFKGETFRLANKPGWYIWSDSSSVVPNP